jgi:hypothetical protein
VNVALGVLSGDLERNVSGETGVQDVGFRLVPDRAALSKQTVVDERQPDV